MDRWPRAQPGAQENGFHEVAGSIPISSTNSLNDLQQKLFRRRRGFVLEEAARPPRNRSRAAPRVRDLVAGATRIVSGGPSWWCAWTPDGRRIVYIHMNPEGTAGNLYWKAADGMGAEDA
jgi:hypothetical protein